MGSHYPVRARKTVRLLSPPPAALVRLLAAVDVAAQQCQQSLILTSGADTHPDGNPHMRGLALDVAAAALGDEEVLAIKRALEEYLGPAFTVLYECPRRPSSVVLQPIAYINPLATGPHFHLQVKKGTTWPAEVLTGGRDV